MGEVISLADRLRKKSQEVTYEQGEYPIFEGKVVAVSAEIIDNGKSLSLVDYLPAGTELPEQNLALKLAGQGIKEYEAKVQELVQRVLVPFSVSPGIINGENVKGHIKEIQGVSVYSLEVLENENITDGARRLGALAGHQLGSKYAGFQYLVPLGN